VVELSLEDIMLAYLGAGRAGAEPRPLSGVAS
jgi:hypothetical protein